MNTQKARNTAAGMVRDALERLVKCEAVQDLRHFSNTKDEAKRLLDFADAALSYFERCYDFPQEEAFAKLEKVRETLANASDIYDSDLLDEIDEIVKKDESESEVA